MFLEIDMTSAQSIIQEAIGVLSLLGLLPLVSGAVGALVIIGTTTTIIKWIRS